MPTLDKSLWFSGSGERNSFFAIIEKNKKGGL
jgi:hypothetical protein